jgi:Protein of unknown function (DUF3467)
MATNSTTKPITRSKASAGGAAQKMPAAPTIDGGNSIKVNTESEKSSYANFVKLDSTQEEVVISFGLDKTWDGSKGQREIDIGHRIVLSPFAAKRLAQMMQEFVQSYEKKYGALAMK